MKPKHLILLGAPGAGKGTQAGLLCQGLSVAHIASGDLFREALIKKTELGLKAKVYMDKGMLVPDDIAISLILEHLASLGKDKGFVLDGFPRTLEQAKALDKALKQEGRTIDKVIYVKVSQDELLHRLSGRWICRQCQAPYHDLTSPPRVAGNCDRCGGELYQRPDDKMEIIRKRLQVYVCETAPLIDYYSKDKKLVEINGEQNIERVNQELILAISPLLKEEKNKQAIL